MTFSHDEVPGHRRASRILFRQTAKDEPVLVLDRGRLDPAIQRRMTLGGHFQLSFSLPDKHRCQLAALKNAYLAACLLLRKIPDTPQADAVRDELMNVRDAPRRHQPVTGKQFAGILVGRSHGPAVPGEVALVEVHPSSGKAPQIAISLARTLLVGWPLGGYLVGLGAAGQTAFVHKL